MPEIDTSISVKGAEVSAEVTLFLASAESLSIATQGEYEAAATLHGQVSRLKKRIEDERKAQTRPIDDAKKRIMDQYREVESSLERGKDILSTALSAYQRGRDAEAMLLQIAAEKERQAAIQAAEQEADRKRLALLAEAEKVEALSVLDDDEEAAVDAFLAAERIREEAERISAAPVPMAAPVAPTYQKAAGLSTRTYWKFRIDDPDLVPPYFLCPDLKKIGEYVKEHKGMTDIPGVYVYDSDTMVGG